VRCPLAWRNPGFFGFEFSRCPECGASRPVSRVLYGARFRARDGHSSGTAVAGRLEQPTRATDPETDPRIPQPRNALRRPYSVLLPVGLAMPLMLPRARCALTAPFHPCLAAVCFLWRFPWGCPRRKLSGTVSPWSPDFPPLQSGGHPAGWPGPHRRSRRFRQLSNWQRARGTNAARG
jgi:hypothetical protein